MDSGCIRRNRFDLLRTTSRGEPLKPRKTKTVFARHGNVQEKLEAIDLYPPNDLGAGGLSVERESKILIPTTVFWFREFASKQVLCIAPL
jgi:hypothetical protein